VDAPPPVVPPLLELCPATVVDEPPVPPLDERDEPAELELPELSRELPSELPVELDPLSPDELVIDWTGEHAANANPASAIHGMGSELRSVFIGKLLWRLYSIDDACAARKFAYAVHAGRGLLSEFKTPQFCPAEFCASLSSCDS